MAGFIRAETVMHISAQSGSIWSGLFVVWTNFSRPDWVGLGQIGSLPLCAVNFGDLVDLHTMSNRSSTHWCVCTARGKIRFKTDSSRDSHHAASQPASQPTFPWAFTHSHTHLGCVHTDNSKAFKKKKKEKQHPHSFQWDDCVSTAGTSTKRCRQVVPRFNLATTYHHCHRVAQRIQYQHNQNHLHNSSTAWHWMLLKVWDHQSKRKTYVWQIHAYNMDQSQQPTFSSLTV